MKRHMESLGQVLSEGLLVDDELMPVSAFNRTLEATTPLWAVRPHVRPTVAPVAASVPVAVGGGRLSAEAALGSGVKTVFSSAIKLSICSHVELFYYSDLYMSRCLKDLQEVYQVRTENYIGEISRCY